MTDRTPNRDIYSVSRLNAELRAVIEGSLPLLWVEGEVSNLATPRSGHLYFSLKDAHAQVRCALFRGKRMLLRDLPADGDRVLVRARAGLYEPRGDLQLIVEHLEPAGAGDAQRAFEALKRKLQAEGLFDAARKRELPAFPRRIGVITSASGAAIRDVLQVLRRRAPQIRVTVYPALVQGQGAADSLYEALGLALARRDCDLLLLTRGGGSVEDLAAFNDERLARAIAAAELPIVSAVGHEIDFSISDFVADRRAPTPSAAAELISPDGQALLDRLTADRRRLQAGLARQLDRERRRVDSVAGRLQRAAPANRLRQQQQRIDQLDLRLARAVRTRLGASGSRLDSLRHRLAAHGPGRELAALRARIDSAQRRLLQSARAQVHDRRERLGALGRQLQALSPLATLQRGYAVLRAPDRRTVIESVGQVEPGMRLNGLLADGELELRVERIPPAER
jgi:exodeoxyribonuclease VII large subunit